MPMIILKNPGRQRFVFTLYHDLVCARTGRCLCETQLVPGPEGKSVLRRLPASVQIDPGSQSPPLPDAVFNIPQVRKAVNEPPYRLKRAILTEAEYAAAVKQLEAAADERRLKVLNAQRAEKGLPPLPKAPLETPEPPPAKPKTAKPKARTADKE